MSSTKSGGMSMNLVNETALTFKNLKAKSTEQTLFGVQKGSLLADKNIYCLPPSILKVTSMNVKFVSFMQKVTKKIQSELVYFRLLTSFMKTVNFSRFPLIR